MAVNSMSKLWAVVIVLVAASTWIQRVVRADPPNCGPSANGNKCGGGYCCSKYGFCGTGDDYCKGSNCQSGYGKCDGGSCFPGDATILMRNGIEKPISQLSIGDEVAVWLAEDGTVVYDEVYANGHTDPYALSEFVAITLRSGNATRKLQLTAHHFVPVMISKGPNMQYKKAKDVVVGDMMITSDTQGINLVVTGLEKEMLRGLFNPFTMRGTIVVNNVVASCHSDWFLDSIFDQLGLSHLLPSTYQAFMTPIRLIYKHLGSDGYKSLYTRLDKQYSIASSGNHFGGYLKLIVEALSYAAKGVSKTF